MTTNEYTYLQTPHPDPYSDSDWFHVGQSCYEMGWIDNQGYLTAKGKNDMEAYEQQPICKTRALS